LQATVDDDLPELERAVREMVETLPEEDEPPQGASSEGTAESTVRNARTVIDPLATGAH
jgi:hypothetical protein